MRRFTLVLIVVMVAASCNRGAEEMKVSANAEAPVLVGDENVVRAEGGEIVAGPLVSGEIQATQSATIRAEVGGTLTQVRVDEGQRISRGQLLARIAVEALEDARDSARSAVASAEVVVGVSSQEVARAEDLVKAGAIPRRDLDQARSNLALAGSQLALARSNLASSEQQLEKTTLRSPITGIVSRRNVDAGDVVGVGAELLTIVDPSSMRLVASVNPAEIGEIAVGDSVQYLIHGYGSFTGKVERIIPQADPVTRQVPVHISVPKSAVPLTAGLFAEGRIVTDSATGPIVPFDAINMDDDPHWVLLVRDGVAERVNVSIGLQDKLTERVHVSSGVEAGDILLRGTSQAIRPGTRVSLSH